MNVILCLIDSLRRDHLGCYGNDWIQTPNLDRLAAEATVFDDAYIGSYPCMPARRDLFTGRFEFPWRGWGPLEYTDLDLPSLLTANGHIAMMITDHYHYWEKGAGNYHFGFSGCEFIRGQEADTWRTDPVEAPGYGVPLEKLANHIRPGGLEQYKRNTAGFQVESDHFAPRVFQQAIDWLQRNRDQKDFFLMVECFDPHEPFDPPAPYRHLYNDDPGVDEIIWPKYGHTNLTERELNRVKGLYAGEVTMVDRWFGRMMETVDGLGLTGDTTIIVCTDHGHLFGEHGLVGKPWRSLSDSNLYQPIAHMPLIVRHPRQPRARRIKGPVQLVDLFPTILEAMGVDVPRGVHGASLQKVLLGQEERTPRLFAYYGRFGEAFNITDGRWTLFRWPMCENDALLYWHSALPPLFGSSGRFDIWPEAGRFRVGAPVSSNESCLFDLEQDYQQSTNRIAEAQDITAHLSSALLAWLREIDAPGEVLNRLGLK